MRIKCALSVWVYCATFINFTSAEVIIEVDQIPTVDMPGYTTYYLTATTREGVFIGFNFDASNDSGFGFVGPMNQVNPAGVPTVFDDMNVFFPYVGASVTQDSQFKVTSSTGVSVNPSEAPDHLSASFNCWWGGDAGTDWTFAQICSPDGACMNYAGTFTVKLPTGENVLFSVYGCSNLDCSFGDYDHDRDVDGNDFLLWQRGESPIPLSCGDLIIWEFGFGITLSSSSTAIPESSTLCLSSLIILTVSALACWRMSRNAVC